MNPFAPTLFPVRRWFVLAALLLALAGLGAGLTPPAQAGGAPSTVFFGNSQPLSGVTLHWSGASDARWSNPANWMEGRVPGALDTAQFDAGVPDAITDAAFAGTVGRIVVTPDYTGTITLTRSLTVRGDVTLGGGALIGSTSPLWIAGSVRVTDGLLTTPGALMRATALDIRAPGLVRMGANGKLELTGAGTPLTGNGQLDTTTNGGNSVEYTGHATGDLMAAEPLRGSPVLALPKPKDKLSVNAPEGFARSNALALNTGQNNLRSTIESVNWC